MFGLLLICHINNPVYAFVYMGPVGETSILQQNKQKPGFLLVHLTHTNDKYDISAQLKLFNNKYGFKN